jgi:capsular exopolysaccharide synthesis family protein
MEEINLREVSIFFLKRLWLIIILTIIFTMFGYFYITEIETPLYQSYTTLILTKSDTQDEITQTELQINEQLVSSYSEIIKSKKILRKIIVNLQLNYSIVELSEKINVSNVADTSLIKISVTDENPNRAASIANQIAEVFSKEIIDIFNINNVKIIDVAEASNVPYNTQIIKQTIIFSIIGLIISAGIVFLLYYFDSTIKSYDTVGEKIQLPVLGLISKSSRKRKRKLITSFSPKSRLSEELRTIRTNLQFSIANKEFKSILITSSIPSEGKSFVSSNLAIIFAETYKKVLLVDCDMRKGRQHEIFGISNTNGLSDLLLSDSEKNYANYVKKTNVKNLSIITRGHIPSNPGELLNSDKNKRLLEVLSDAYDLIIYDCVPVNGLSDSIIMSNIVDEVFIVCCIGYTPIKLLKNTKKALVNTPLAGIIINKIPSLGKHYYDRYYYGRK